MKPQFVLILVPSILVLSNGECDLHPQEHPIVDKLLHLDYVQSFGHGIPDLARICHGFLGNLSFAFLLQLVSRIIFFVSRLFPISMSKSLPFLMTYSGN